MQTIRAFVVVVFVQRDKRPDVSGARLYMNETPSVIWQRNNRVNNGSVLISKPHVFLYTFPFQNSHPVWRSAGERTRFYLSLLFIFYVVYLFIFVNSQARLKARARGRIRLKAIMAPTPRALDHGVQGGKEAGVLWGGRITLLLSDSLDWHTGQLWSCLKATQPKDFSLQPSLMRQPACWSIVLFQLRLVTHWLVATLSVTHCAERTESIRRKETKMNTRITLGVLSYRALNLYSNIFPFNLDFAGTFGVGLIFKICLTCQPQKMCNFHELY